MQRLESLVLYHTCFGELANGPPRALRVLEIQMPLGRRPPDWDDAAAALGRGEALPHLRSLSIVVRDAWAGWRPTVDDYAPILDGALAKRLEHLRIECCHAPRNTAAYAPRAIGLWLAAVRERGVTVPVLELDDGIRSAPVIYRFERDPDGRHRLRSVETHYGRDPQRLVGILCEHLRTLQPDDVASAIAFRFVSTKLDAASLDQIRETVQRFPGVTPTGL
jgi:hypothetical protein